MRFWFKNQFIPKKMNFMLTGVINRVVDSQKFAKAGFTLAEVLITLGIIGIVAAMTLPNLIANNKARRFRSQFLKSYSTIQQVFKMMQADDVSTNPSDYDSYNSTGLTGRNLYYKKFMEYLNAPMDCGLFGSAGITDNNIKNTPCYYPNSKDSKHYQTFDNVVISDGGSLFDDGQVVLQDGELLLFDFSGYISVDINGYNTPPNRWGYDLFTFQILENGIRPMGDFGTSYHGKLDEYCDKSKSNKINGITCAQKAKENSEYFKMLFKK